MKKIEYYQKKLYKGGLLQKEELLELSEEPLEQLCRAADEIRRHFCGTAFDLCAVISAKGGRCTEDCAFCPQSGISKAIDKVPEFPLLGAEELVSDVSEKDKKGIMAYGIVASGRVISGNETEQLAKSLTRLRKTTNIRLCASLGLLDRQKLERLRDAGLQMVHNNLESSEKHFRAICTTHTYEEKKNVIRAAKEAGLSVCSGGLFGIGESMEDRIELALNERDLGVDSVPVNMFAPVPGTPLERSPLPGVDDMRRIVAIFRFALPDTFIRLAAGREYLEDQGRSCFLSGANAAISGDFLTTMGISIETDRNMLREIGYDI